MIVKNNNSNHCNIDGDLIVFMVASACDGKYYTVDGQDFKYIKDVKKYYKDKGETYKQPEAVYDPEPWAEVKNSMDSMIEGILLNTRSKTSSIFVTGYKNFRKHIATILPYKGSRLEQRKPFHLKSCREYIVNECGATFQENMEADDILGLCQTDSTILCTIDKDLDIVPGPHFNFTTNTLYTISDVEADRNFYKQVLTGDRTDDILGLYGIGAKSTLLSKLDSMDQVTEMHNHVFKEYQARFGTYADMFMIENCQLLWILQQRPAYWMEFFDVGNYWGADYAQG